MAKKKKEDNGADAEEAQPVTEFKAKLNKYNFIHVPKKAIASLPFKAEEKLKATIEGETVVIRKA